MRKSKCNGLFVHSTHLNHLQVVYNTHYFGFLKYNLKFDYSENKNVNFIPTILGMVPIECIDYLSLDDTQSKVQHKQNNFSFLFFIFPILCSFKCELSFLLVWWCQSINIMLICKVMKMLNCQYNNLTQSHYKSCFFYFKNCEILRKYKLQLF